MKYLRLGDPKYAWAALIAVVALTGLTATTLVAMFHWPIEPDVVRTTNTIYGNVLTFVLGVFTGASFPTAAVAVASSAAARTTPATTPEEFVLGETPTGERQATP
jgi:hypothetical protein